MFLKDWLDEDACLSKMLADKTVESMKVDDISIRFRNESKEVLENFEVSSLITLFIERFCVTEPLSYSMGFAVPVTKIMVLRIQFHE